MHKYDRWTILGYLLMLIGFMSLFFSLVGIRFKFLRFIDEAAGGFSFLIYIFLVMAGLIAMYLSKTLKAS